MKTGPSSIFGTEDVTVTDCATSGAPLYLNGCLFRHVVLRGRVGSWNLNELPKSVPDDVRDVFADTEREFYLEGEYALDISEAILAATSMFSLPGDLVRQDPETQFLIRRERVVDADLSMVSSPMQRWLRRAARSPFDSTVFVVGRDEPNFAESPASHRQLIDLGFAEARYEGSLVMLYIYFAASGDDAAAAHGDGAGAGELAVKGVDPADDLVRLEAIVTGRSFETVRSEPRRGVVVAKFGDGDCVVLALSDSLGEALAAAETETLRRTVARAAVAGRLLGNAADPDVPSGSPRRCQSRSANSLMRVATPTASSHHGLKTTRAWRWMRLRKSTGCRAVSC